MTVPAAPRLPRKKRGNPELQAQIAIVAALRLALPRGSVLYRVTNEQRAKPGATPEQRMRFHQARAKTGVCFGFPDFGVLLPAPLPDGGRTLLFEVKSKAGRLHPRQADLHAHLGTIGVPVFTVRDPQEAVDALRSIGISPRASRLDP
jgi:hypothetical protein